MSRITRYKKGDIVGGAEIIRRSGTSGNGGALWLCKCSCGNPFIKESSNLKRNLTKCPTCQRKLTSERIGNANRKSKYVIKDSKFIKKSTVKKKRKYKIMPECKNYGCSNKSHHECRGECRTCFIGNVEWEPQGICSNLSAAF